MSGIVDDESRCYKGEGKGERGVEGGEGEELT